MPNLDNHMDELFQKAAENYPLKTEAGNFDDLMPFIAGEKTAIVNPAAKGKRKTTLLMLAVLFIGFTIGTTYLMTKNYNNKIINNEASVKDKSIFAVQNNTVSQQLINFDAAVDAKVQEANTSSNIYQKHKLASYTKGNIFTQITSPVAEADEDSDEINNRPENIKNAEANTKVRINNSQPDYDETEIAKVKKDNIDQPDKKRELTVNETKTADKKAKKNKNKYKPGIYYGIATGVELNEVKGQPMTKVGLNVGVILGLQINQKTAIETGVQVSQKKYYSEGKHFKPKAGSMPANMYINSLQSTSTIIEIPVSVKYNFSKKKNTLYAKAGVSSYIMTKESNKYQAVVSGLQQEINSTYKTNQAYIASEVRISAGYQHSIGKKSNIRVEPYIQIPLKGIGIGTMPVTSTGLQLVLTRN